MTHDSNRPASLFSTHAAIAALYPATTIKAAVAAARAIGITIRRELDDGPARGFDVFPKGFGNQAMFADSPAEALFLAECMAQDADANRLSLAGPVTLASVAQVLARRAAANAGLAADAITIRVEGGALFFDGGSREYRAPFGRQPLAEIAAIAAPAAEAAAGDARAIAAEIERARAEGITVEATGEDWQSVAPFYAQRGEGTFGFGRTLGRALDDLRRREASELAAELADLTGPELAEREAQELAAIEEHNAAAYEAAGNPDAYAGPVAMAYAATRRLQLVRSERARRGASSQIDSAMRDLAAEHGGDAPRRGLNPHAVECYDATPQDGRAAAILSGEKSVPVYRQGVEVARLERDADGVVSLLRLDGSRVRSFAGAPTVAAVRRAMEADAATPAGPRAGRSLSAAVNPDAPAYVKGRKLAAAREAASSAGPASVRASGAIRARELAGDFDKLTGAERQEMAAGIAAGPESPAEFRERLARKLAALREADARRTREAIARAKATPRRDCAAELAEAFALRPIPRAAYDVPALRKLAARAGL